MYEHVEYKEPDQPGFVRRHPKIVSLVACTALLTPLHGENAIERVYGFGSSQIEDGSCQEVSGESIEAVTELFSRPAARPDVSGLGNAPVGADQRDHDNARKIDESITLPTYDARQKQELQATLNRDGKSGPQIVRPFTAYFDFAQDILSQSDIQLQLGPPPSYSKTYFTGTGTPAPIHLNTPRAKNEVMAIAETFAELPLEFTRTIPLRTIALTTGSKIHLGMAQAEHKNYLVDITLGDGHDYGVAKHELYHIEDDVVCRNSNNHDDPDFADLNPNGEYAPKTGITNEFLRAHPPSYLEIFKQSKAQARPVGFVATNPSHPGSDTSPQTPDCPATIALSEPIESVQMFSNYGYTNVAEDKADIGQWSYTQSDVRGMLDNRSPIIRAKMILLLARRYEIYPDFVRYTAATNSPTTAAAAAC